MQIVQSSHLLVLFSLYFLSVALEEEGHFNAMNEKEVDNITMDLFYKPHTITLLLFIIIGLLYVAFSR